jgi:hypothetical protein
MGHVLTAVRIFFRNLHKYAALIILCYGPWLFLIKYFAIRGVLSEEADEAVAGVLSIFFMPLCNGATVWMNHRHADGHSVSIKEGLLVSVEVWKELLTAYISVGLIILGWAALAIIPAGLIMLVFDVKNTLVLVPFVVAVVLYVSTRYVFLDFFVVLRKLPGWQSRRYCTDMSQGRMLSLLVAYFFLAAPIFFSEFAYGYFGAQLEQLTGVAKQIFAGLLSILGTLLYVIPQIYFYLLYRDFSSNQPEITQKPAV